MVLVDVVPYQSATVEDEEVANGGIWKVSLEGGDAKISSKMGSTMRQLKSTCIDLMCDDEIRLKN